MEESFPPQSLEFESEPDATFIWFGTASLTLQVKGDGNPYQIAAHVYEVLPDDTAVLLTTGRVCNWDGQGGAAGAEVTIPLEARGQRIRPQSRIRVTLTNLDMSSAAVHTFPMLDAFAVDVSVGGDEPSMLKIPVFKPPK